MQGTRVGHVSRSRRARRPPVAARVTDRSALIIYFIRAARAAPAGAGGGDPGDTRALSPRHPETPSRATARRDAIYLTICCGVPSAVFRRGPGAEPDDRVREPSLAALTLWGRKTLVEKSSPPILWEDDRIVEQSPNTRSSSADAGCARRCGWQGSDTSAARAAHSGRRWPHAYRIELY